MEGRGGLADDVRYYGRWMREEAEKKIGHLYPKVKLKDGKTKRPSSHGCGRARCQAPIRARRVRTCRSPLVRAVGEGGQGGDRQAVVDRAKMTWAFEIDDKPSKRTSEGGEERDEGSARSEFRCLLTGAAMTILT